MALPKIANAEYPLTLPISKKVIKFRPFLVKEEKLLLTAIEGFDPNNPSELTVAILNVVNSCITTKNVVAEELSNVDIEWLFLNIRKKSVGEIVEVQITHECQGVNKVAVHLGSCEVVHPDKGSNKIMLTDDVGVIMRYPTLAYSLDSLKKKDGKVEVMFSLIAECIETVFSGDDFTKIDTPDEKAELIIWLESLNTDQFRKLYEFFDTIPYIKTPVDYTCEHCGKHEHMEITGTSDFFT